MGPIAFPSSSSLGRLEAFFDFWESLPEACAIAFISANTSGPTSASRLVSWLLELQRNKEPLILQLHHNLHTSTSSKAAKHLLDGQFRRHHQHFLRPGTPSFCRFWRMRSCDNQTEHLGSRKHLQYGHIWPNENSIFCRPQNWSVNMRYMRYICKRTKRSSS